MHRFVVLCVIILCYLTAVGEPLNKLKIIELRAGNGQAIASKQRLRAHFKVWLYDETKPENKGTLIDNSYVAKKPVLFDPSEKKILPGLVLGIQGMKVAEKRRILIPANLAYGEHEEGIIPKSSDLVYEIEIIDVLEDQKENK